MDERIKIGLKAGAVSLLGLIVGNWVFLIVGRLVVDFGEKTFRSTTDVVVSSLTAAVPFVVLQFLIPVYDSSYLEALLIRPALSCILSMSVALLFARIQLGIPIDIKEILYNPIFHKTVCPVCGRKVKDAWIFCPHCKTALGMITCPHCGLANPSTAVRCQICGISLKEEGIHENRTKKG